MIDYAAIYTQMVQAGKISIDKVPMKYREAVRERLKT